MAKTDQSFSSMLKRYMPYNLLSEEFKKRNFFWNKVRKDNGWEEGVLEVPLVQNEASSLNWGTLTATGDIAEAKYTLGTLTSQPELWGTMQFHEKDLRRHVSMEKSYLKILPGKIEQFVDAMSERVSIQLLDDGSVAKATVDGQIGGDITLGRAYLLQIDEKVEVVDDDTAAVVGYVRSIDINTGVVNLFDARTGGAAVNLSAYTVAQNARVIVPTAGSEGMTSLSGQLLSAANGGSANIAGVSKASHPMLQARNISGSGFTSATLTNDVFDAMYDIAARGRGQITEILMSYENYRHIAQDIETSRRYAKGEASAGFGFTTVSLIGPKGGLKITALRDMPDDKMYFMDWSAMRFFHPKNAFERKRIDGQEFFTVRAVTGYTYLVDIRFAGDLLVQNPSHCGVVHSIPVL